METLGPEAGAMPSGTFTATPVALATPERVTERQVEAVYAVMRLLRNDRSEAGANETILCARCNRERPGQGSVQYGAKLLCNGCATDYELLRVARNVRGIDDFLLHT
jgi:hypothetical protein